jgi:hypothetical protein
VRPTTAFSFSKMFGLLLLGICAFAWATAGAFASESEVEGTPPSIVSEAVSGVTTANAVLEAEIVPGDLSGEFEGMGGAWYQFQLVADPSEYWPEVTCPEQPPESPIECLGPLGVIDGPPPQASITRRPGDLPTEGLGGSFEVHSVSLDLESIGVTLQPGTTYHYRLIAVEDTGGVDTIEWATPPVYGPDQTFTTSSPPIIPPVDVSTPSQAPPVVTGPAPQVNAPRANKQRCPRKKRINLRRPAIQCRHAAFRPR